MLIFVNFADDTTPYAEHENSKKVLESLENNCIVLPGYIHEYVCAKIGTEKIPEKKDVKLLGISIDNELKFDKYVLEICCKASTN